MRPNVTSRAFLTWVLQVKLKSCHLLELGDLLRDCFNIFFFSFNESIITTISDTFLLIWTSSRTSIHFSCRTKSSSGWSRKSARSRTSWRGPKPSSTSSGSQVRSRLTDSFQAGPKRTVISRGVSTSASWHSSRRASAWFLLRFLVVHRRNFFNYQSCANWPRTTTPCSPSSAASVTVRWLDSKTPGRNCRRNVWGSSRSAIFNL